MMRLSSLWMIPLIVLTAFCQTQAAARREAPILQPYEKPNELEPLPPGKASLYRAPWRANLKTASAHKALQSVGMYYKHVPDWSEAEHTAVMQQLYECGMRHLQFSPHWCIFIHKDWAGPRPGEEERLRKELSAARAVGIRPFIGIPHIAPMGKPGTRELQEWWRQGELLPVGEIGSPEYEAYVEKTFQAVSMILDEARNAGFTEPNSFDLGLGQALWWGAPSVPRPAPSTTVDDLRPGGVIYEFENDLMQKLRKAGYNQPNILWNLHHHFEKITEDELPPAVGGRVVSMYGAFTGKTTAGWLENTQYDKPVGVRDLWPLREKLEFMEGDPPSMVLARPESWAADRSRRDNLIEFINRSTVPVYINSLGAVPGSIPNIEESPFSGWEIKQRALTRSLAFWLNQGAEFVMIHSAYEPRSKLAGEMKHSLIPNPIDPATFNWQDAPPLRTYKAFCDGLAGASQVQNLRNLKFNYALTPDPVLIPASAKSDPMKASDLVALLPFQISEDEFAVAAYVLTPNIAKRMEPLEMTLEVDCVVAGEPVLMRPYNSMRIIGEIAKRTESSTTIQLTIYDDVTWIRFRTR